MKERARACPEISVFVLFSGVVAVGDRGGVCHGERVNFGSICPLEGWNDASLSPLAPHHMHISVLNRRIMGHPARVATRDLKIRKNVYVHRQINLY
jgi:hypothetical protein